MVTFGVRLSTLGELVTILIFYVLNTVILKRTHTECTHVCTCAGAGNQQVHTSKCDTDSPLSTHRTHILHVWFKRNFGCGSSRALRDARRRRRHFRASVCAHWFFSASVRTYNSRDYNKVYIPPQQPNMYIVACVCVHVLFYL